MTRLRTIAFLAVAGMGAAVTAERWIGSLLASGDGPDPTMKMVIAIDAPIETVWEGLQGLTPRGREGCRGAPRGPRA